MVVWGGGDPGTRYPSIHQPSTLVDFLKSTDRKIIFSDHHFQTTRFGRGWSWDDFPYNFQPERTAFPIYGNKLWVERYRDSIVITPEYFKLVFSAKNDTIQKLTRNEWGTQFNYRYDRRIPQSVNSIPVSLYRNDIRYIWEEAIGKKLFFLDYPLDKNAIRIDGSERDSLVKWMLHESDNFVAEQLLLSCALKQNGSMNEKEFIQQMMRGPLSDMPDSISWIDGSGLSRYNLLTPRSVVWVLEKLLSQKGPEYLKSMLAAGGTSGTIRNSFLSADGDPYIFAKSGSMRNVYCASGLLITNNGNVLIFSWMNNHFKDEPATIIKSMEIFLKQVREHY